MGLVKTEDSQSTGSETKLFIKCHCGKREIDVGLVTDQLGLINNATRQCPKCWGIVDMVAEDV